MKYIYLCMILLFSCQKERPSQYCGKITDKWITGPDHYIRFESPSYKMTILVSLEKWQTYTIGDSECIPSHATDAM